MASYCFVCTECDHEHTVSQLRTNEYCCECQAFMRRNWKGEAVGFTTVPGGYKEANRGR